MRQASNLIKKIGFVSFALLFTGGCVKKSNEIQEPNPTFGLHTVAFTTSRGSLTPSARLRKLSVHLRGILPVESEYDALDQAIAAKTTDEFFSAKTSEYLKTPEYIGKMMTRLDQLLRMRTTSDLPEALFNPQSSAPPELVNAEDLLYYEILANNLSWDSLLTRKEYMMPDPYGFTGMVYDKDYYQMVVPELLSPMEPGKLNQINYNRIKFSPTDPRIAGIITTGRFFSRYSTTNVNRNRGRASALFRTFLCDDMRAVVTPKPGEDGDLVNQAFPKPVPDANHASVLDDDPHGSDPNCMSCHYKLDPLGRGFLTSGSILSEDTSPGVLTYRRPTGELVSVPGNGLGELAEAIKLQPEYAQCQVMHFWNWFIQGDDPPTVERFAELVKQFDGLGHKTNDFVAFLVNQPEFYRDPNIAPENVTLVQVKNSLQRCTNCHAGVTPSMGKPPIPSFVSMPIGSDADHQKWVKDIVKVLDLAGSGENRTMPPATSAWQPSAEELGQIKKWIASGVRDESGKITIDPKITQGWLQ